MGIGGIGQHGDLTQNVRALLASITSSQPATGATANNDFGTGSTSGSAAPTTSCPSPNGMLAGSTKAAISDEILALLTQLQQLASTLGGSQQSSTLVGASSVASVSTAIAPSSTSIDPLSKLFSAIDSNGDGIVSQTELESYVRTIGGTNAEADALFAGLDQNGSGGLTEAQLSSDLQQAQTAGGTHHRHHGHHAPSAAELGNQLASAIDTNGDGLVSQGEFTSFVTGLGGSTAEAASDFGALDPNNTGSVNAGQIAAAIRAFEQAGNAAGTSASSTSPILTLLDAFTKATPAAGAAAGVTA